MIVAGRALLLVIWPILLYASVTQDKAEETARAFLPPGARIATLETFDPKTGQRTESAPAALSGHVLSANSNDIIVAYETTAEDIRSKSLFVTLLHKTKSGYDKLFELTYFNRFLWVQDFSTVGLRIIRLPGDSQDSLAITTAIGASLGGQLEVFRWQDGLGLLNLMPDHPAAHRISILREKNQLTVELSYEKYPGERGAPPAIFYRWDGQRFTRQL